MKRTRATPRILVAEDDPLILSLIADVLVELGYDVMRAASGTEAFELIDDPQAIDMVVTDVNMPGPDGVMVAQRARAVHPRIPVLFVTALADQLTARQAPNPYRFLAKPFRLTDLRREVTGLLGAA